MSPSDPKPLSLEQRRELGYALAHLATSYNETDEWRVKDHAERAILNLVTFVNDLSPAPQLTEYEGEVAGSIHTYLRKYTDGPHGTMLYAWIKLSKGYGVWTAFIKGLVADNFDLRDGWNAAESYQRDNDTPDNHDMRLLLQMWPEKEFKIMIGMFREDGWFDFPAKPAKRGVVKN